MSSQSPISNNNNNNEHEKHTTTTTTPKSTNQLKQQNEKLKKNLHKAIQAAKDARAQRQKLSDQIKNMKIDYTTLQTSINDKNDIISKMEIKNQHLIKQNDLLTTEINQLQLEFKKQREKFAAKQQQEEAQLKARKNDNTPITVEPTTGLDIGNNNETKGTLLNDSTNLRIKETKKKKK